MKRFLSWNAAYYICLVLSSFISIPLYYENVEPSQFTILSILWSTVAISTILDFGVGRSLTQEVGKITNEKIIDKYPEIISSGLAATISAAVVGSLVVFTFLRYYFNTDFDQADLRISIYLTSAIVFLSIIGNVYSNIFEGLHSIKVSTLNKSISAIIYMVVPAYLLYSNNITKLSEILIIGVLARAMLLSVYSYISILHGYVKCSFVRRDIVKRLLKKGYWYTVSNISSIFMTHGDRFVLGTVGEKISINNYYVSSELVQRGSGLLNIVSTSLYPRISGLQDITMRNKIIGKSFALVNAIIISVVVLNWIFIDDFIAWWINSNDSLEMVLLIKIMSLGWVASGYSQLYLAQLHSYGDSRSSAIVHIAEASLFVPLMFLIVSKYGSVGAAYLWTARLIIDAILLRYMLNRFERNI